MIFTKKVFHQEEQEEKKMRQRKGQQNSHNEWDFFGALSKGEVKKSKFLSRTKKMLYYY